MKESAQNPIPVILGQTASAKTSIGIALAKLMDGEIISVDSRKVYEGLPIGTATPPGDWKDGVFWVENVAHHLMGFLKPDQPYNAGDFAADAGRLIDQIQSRGKVPILVGGTGFYFKALSQGLPPLPKGDAEFRAELEKEIESRGAPFVWEKLKQADPDSAAHISPGDPHKIIRALEVTHFTGRPFSAWKNQKKAPERPFKVMGLLFAKEQLEKRIEERSRWMAEHGMIEETEAALGKGYAPDCPALASFGYKEAVQVIQGQLPRNEFLPLLIKGTKAYAKRQKTWFRTQTKPAWFACDEILDKHEMAERMKAFCYTRAT